ncbi:caskin-2-like isoform X3 [Stylophora pistillata]|uniref:caskin-2-like isoform X3 n=1 Tax=Stylophora pistillata TaxID=50429 RepID=UPI000C053717|nr:caskin-2-like isoform X3 [Stylophora pistillata]
MAKDQELLQAAKANDLNAFRKIVAKIKAAKSKKGGKKYSVNIQDEEGFTPTHHASLRGSSEIVIALIELECDVNAKDKKGMTPLHLAAWSGKVEVTRLLLEAGAEVNSCSQNGDTPLILACQHGNSDVADVLLDRKCSTLAVNNNGEAALDLACRFGHVHVVELLLNCREVRSALATGAVQRTDPPLHAASKTGHVEIIRMLLEADANINQVTSNGSCLHEAALYGKTDVVKLLLDWGIKADIRNGEGHTALDVVNLFTSSKASAVIKQLLKDAASADGTVYAKAVRDHFNMMDSTALPFKTGETVIVLEQNQNDRWKGKIKNGDRENVGYFPANFVRITALRRGSGAKKSPNPKEAGVIPMGSYETIALPSVPSSPGFQRNSPRLRSFGKKDHRFRGDQDMEPNKVLVEPNLPGKGVKANKGSVKMAAGLGLQYVEVAVDKPPLSPPQASTAGNKLSNKTNYAEVRLPTSNGSVEEVDESDEPPQLPDKGNKETTASNEMEDIWVRNTSTPPPSLPPKARALSKSDPSTTACDSIELGAKSASPPASLPHFAEQSRPEGPPHANVTGLNATERPARRVATPELSRKGYEDMSLTPVSGGRATPPCEDIWKLQAHNIKEHPPKQGLAYENVQLTHRAKLASDMQSMLICDVDQPGKSVGADGYVFVNGPSSTTTTDSKGYENVTPSAPKPVEPGYVNIPNEVTYLAMTGGVSADSTTTRTSKQAPDEDNEDTDNDESKDGMDYELMNSCPHSISHQYVNISRQGDVGSPAEATGHLQLKMRDYNALFDWLEKFKLAIYIDNFVKGGFDMTSVPGITAEDLTAINVNKTGHRKKVLSESAKLEETTVFPKKKPEDIMTWLRLIGLEQYIPEFMDGGFDDMDFLQDMTLEDLVAIGVKKPGHQRKIWMAVNALKQGDENENMLESVEEELTPLERKDYLETCLDGEDSGVSTDEVEASEISTEENRRNSFPTPATPIENTTEEPIVEDSSSAESEIPETSAVQPVVKEEKTIVDAEQDQQRIPVPEEPCLDVQETTVDDLNFTADLSLSKEKDGNENELDSLSLHVQNVISFPDSDDDEPPPRPPPPMEDIDLSLPTADLCQLEFELNGPGRSVKDLVSKGNGRGRTLSLDPTFQRPKKPAPPPVKPKSAKKPPPPKVPPKPRKTASFTAGYADRSSEERSVGDRSPTKPTSPEYRRSSTGSSPFNLPSPPCNRESGSGNGSVRSRSSSNSSHSSVDSLIEETEERKNTFEKPGRKISAPERFNTSPDSNLDEQIKEILRNRSGEDLSTPPPSESVESSSTVPRVDTKTESLNIETKEYELAEDLMKDINSMLSDFSSELDSMFD